MRLTVEVAEDPAFTRVVASEPTRALAEADHTVRVLVGGLRPATVYPADDDPRPVRFAFVSCQDVIEGAQNAYRRMAFEDEKAAGARARPARGGWPRPSPSSTATLMSR